MVYLQPFTFFVGAAGGFTNLLACAACNLIPVAGQIALLGYRAELADELSRGSGRPPAFGFGRFADYIRRGVWPAVYQLAFGLVVGGLVVVGAVLASVGLEQAARTADPYLWAAAVALAWVAGVLMLATAAAGLLWPMELHAQLSGRFAPRAAAGFAARFQGRVWGQALVSLVVFLVGSSLLNVIGLLACGVGIGLTIVVQFMAQQHLMTQLYRLYLDAGGEPIRGPDADADDGPSRG